MKVLVKSAWGSADPTQAAFPFHHANAFAEAGHDDRENLVDDRIVGQRHVHMIGRRDRVGRGRRNLCP